MRGLWASPCREQIEPHVGVRIYGLGIFEWGFLFDAWSGCGRWARCFDRGVDPSLAGTGMNVRAGVAARVGVVVGGTPWLFVRFTGAFHYSTNFLPMSTASPLYSRIPFLPTVLWRDACVAVQL